MAKVAPGSLDAVILAAAGLERLGHTSTGSLSAGGVHLHASVLETFLPAPGQGAIAVEVLACDSEALENVAGIHDSTSAAEVRAERTVLAALGGGCHLALGARGRASGAALRLEAVVFDHPGAAPKHAALVGSCDDPESLGRAVAAALHG
jgi:hydroxymethylbilane synthase